MPSPAPPGPPPPQMPSLLPNAGHQADLQLINNLVEQLSEVQASNRKEMDVLLKELEEVRKDIGPGSSHQDQPTNSNLKADLLKAQADFKDTQEKLNDTLEAYADLANMTQDYEDVMASMMIKVREFTQAHHHATLAWHAFYLDKLNTTRGECLQLRLEHSHWQEHLDNAMRYARLALRAQTEYECPLRRRIASQRREIMVMRNLLGWGRPDVLDSDDEEEIAEEEAEQARRDMEALQLQNEAEAAAAEQVAQEQQEDEQERRQTGGRRVTTGRLQTGNNQRWSDMDDEAYEQQEQQRR